jgi:hypothetical protein
MASYIAELNQTVQVTTVSENNTVAAPSSAETGHWFAVKIMGLPNAGTMTTVSGNGRQLEDHNGYGIGSDSLIFRNYDYVQWILIDNVWRTMKPPTPIIERYFLNADTLITTSTPIPMTYDNSTVAAGAYWQVNAGNLECIQRFVGICNLITYFDFVLSANNQDAEGIVALTTIAGTPSIGGGYGCAGSAGSARTGSFPMTITDTVTVNAQPGDIIGVIGNNDPAQAGTSTVKQFTQALMAPR